MAASLHLQNRYYIHVNNVLPRATSLKCIPWRFHKGTEEIFIFFLLLFSSLLTSQTYTLNHLVLEKAIFLLGAVLFCHAKDKETHLLL